jgi:transposase-like protein
MSTKEVTAVTVTELWREFNRSCRDLWEFQNEALKRMKKRLLEESLEMEREELVLCGSHERTGVRRDYRNGYYTRWVLTRLGMVEVRVPRLRHLKVRSRVLKRYQRRESEIDEVLKRVFLYGVSTRLAGDAVRPLLGEGVSAQTISAIARGLDAEVQRYHRKPIEDTYLYLFLDGIFLKTKTGYGAKKKVVLVAYGITVSGRREIIDFMVTNAESEVKWEGFLSRLWQRGLKGELLSLIVTDGNTGLHNAIDRVYPHVRRQRCWAHKLRNVANRLPKAHRDACIKEARPIYDAKDRKEAVLRYRQWAMKWRGVAPDAVRCLCEDLEDLLQVYTCPKEIRIKLRTTNVIERVFREVRRRTRPMSCFNNVDSIERIIFAVLSRQNDKWRIKPLQEFTQKS